jgi:hypothetical protein
VFEIIVPLVGLLIALMYWIEWGPIAWRAIRTGRLLGRGRIYDREKNPKMFWFGLIAMCRQRGDDPRAALAADPSVCGGGP